MKPVYNFKMKRCDHSLNLAMKTLYLAVVACSVFVTEGSVFIKECANMGLQLSGVDTEISFTCGGLLVDGTAQWVLRNSSRTLLSLKCLSNSMTCEVTSASITLSMPNKTTSVLTVTNNYTSWSELSYVTCSQEDSTTNNYFRCNISWNRASTSGPTPVPTIQPTQPPQTEATSVTTSTKTSTQGPSSIPSTADEQHNHVSGPSSISSTTDEQRHQDDNDDLPVEAIAGGVAAAIAVIIIIVIIIMIVVLKRRKRQKPAGGEDHVNPLYGREGDPAQASPANGQPAGLALMLPAQDNYSSPVPSKPKPAAAIQRSDDGLDAGYASVAFGDQQQAASPSAGQSSGGPSPQTSAAPQDKAPTCVTDSDMYIAMDGPGLRRGAENADEEKADAGYSTVGISSGPPSANASSAIPSKTAPSGDVYAVVQKSGPMAKSSASNRPADTAAEGADNTYAVVDKSRSNAPASSAGNASPNDHPFNTADNTYAVVDKSRSTAPTSAGNAPSRGYAANSAYVFVGKSSPSENGVASFTTADTTGQASSGDVYAQVDKSAKQGRQALNGDDGEESSQSAPVYAVVNKQPKGENTSTIQTQNGKPKPPTKPKPAVKPKPGTNGFE